MTTMKSLADEIVEFRNRKTLELSEANQRVALQLSCGIDLRDLAGGDLVARKQTLARVERAIQRERMKAAVAHWSYDLNRHIALKQALDELKRSIPGASEAPADTAARRASKNGARRRRPVKSVDTNSSASCACGRGPFSSPVATAQRHNSARPSDTWRPAPTSRDTGQASDCNESSGGASAT